MSDLRKTFWASILEIAKKDKDVILLTGDLGYSFCEQFQKELPDQFINCGCAEQNMVGVASGLARGGKKPYVYSNSIFILMRAGEQVRDDIAYPNLNVKLIGTGASGFLGFTHNLGVLENETDMIKNMPNIKCSYPEDGEQLTKALEIDGPIFIRI